MLVESIVRKRTKTFMLGIKRCRSRRRLYRSSQLVAMLTRVTRLRALKKKIDEHKKHLEELEKNVSDTMAQGGKK